MRILKNKGIAFKLVFFILASCSIIFLIIFGYNYDVSRGIIVNKIEENARNLTLRTVNKVETIILPIEDVPEHIAHMLGDNFYNKEGLLAILRSVIEEHPNVFGTTASFEPYAFDEKLYYYSPYYYRKDGKSIFVNLSASYDYFESDWYDLPKQQNSPLWSEPYYDEGGGEILMSTYSVPIYKDIDGKKEFIGIVTADISLTWLQDIISSIEIEESGYAFLVSRRGVLLTQFGDSVVMRDTIFDVAESEESPSWQQAAEDMTEGKSGFVPIKSTVTGKESWLYYAPIPTTDWSLGILFPKSEMMAGVINLSRVVFALGVIGIIFLLIVIVLISNSITKPLRILAQKTKDIAKGNMDFTLPPIKTGDEVGSLAESFNVMKTALKKYITELTKTTKEKERIESELKIAHDIQMGILPKVFPPFPERREFDIYATLKPAREVGGDFYDFYFIDDRHLCFVVGDVSGKGVPAALFMAVTNTYMRSISKMIRDPRGILASINKELSRENDSCMFVTIFCGILNVETGEMRYSNGGHNEPVLIQEGKDPVFLGGGKGTTIGVFEELSFQEGTIRVNPRDTLYVYTDGVTEAKSKTGDFFEEERLVSSVAHCRKYSVKGLVECTLKEVRGFAKGAPQSDDITIVALRYFGEEAEDFAPKEKEKRLVLKNDVSELQRLTNVVTEFGKENDLAEETIDDVTLALEEIVNNIISYAYEDDSGHQIDVRISMKDQELTVEVIDDGKPFNPLEVPEADIDKPLEEKEAGGLGIHFARHLMDSIVYTREDEENVLVMKKIVITKKK